VRDRVTLVPALITAGMSIGRISRWMSTWAKHDPSRTHSHLGPVAVDLDRQGQGIGGALLGEYCKRIDAVGMASYLETDKVENVRLYERFGFDVTGEANVIGVSNWFMMREPAPS
jgi:predicted N-acetyltransferase YhbS